jgi:hypothetical protein
MSSQHTTGTLARGAPRQTPGRAAVMEKGLTVEIRDRPGAAVMVYRRLQVREMTLP